VYYSESLYVFPLGKYDLIDVKQSLSESLTPVTGGGDDL